MSQLQRCGHKGKLIKAVLRTAQPTNPPWSGTLENEFDTAKPSYHQTMLEQGDEAVMSRLLEKGDKPGLYNVPGTPYKLFAGRGFDPEWELYGPALNEPGTDSSLVFQQGFEGIDEALQWANKMNNLMKEVSKGGPGNS